MSKSHYVVWIESNSIRPSNSRAVYTNYRALKKDPSAIIVTNCADAFHLAMAEFPILHIVFDANPQFGILIENVLPTSPTTHMSETFPIPWGASGRSIIVGCRGALTDEQRKNLHEYRDMDVRI